MDGIDGTANVIPDALSSWGNSNTPPVWNIDLKSSMDAAYMKNSGYTPAPGDKYITGGTEIVCNVTMLVVPFIGEADTAAALTDDLKAASRTSTSNIAANKSAGDAARDAIQDLNPGPKPEQTFTTTSGTRRVDLLTAAGRTIESKAGRTSLTKSIRLQIEKDQDLIRSGQVSDVEWVFSRSAVTGKIGPTKAPRRALTKAGIKCTDSGTESDAGSAAAAKATAALRLLRLPRPLTPAAAGRNIYAV